MPHTIKNTEAKKLRDMFKEAFPLVPGHLKEQAAKKAAVMAIGLALQGYTPEQLQQMKSELLNH